jgi:predicted nucleotidyltransferase
VSVDYLEEIRRIVMEELKDRPAKVFLFGSRARNSARPSSDVDVAVLPLAPLPPAVLSRIRLRLEESCVPLRVDLVDLSEADEPFRSAVLREAIPWSA